MSVKEWISRGEAYNRLVDRKVSHVLGNKEHVEEVLKKTNYFLLINGIESLFLKTPTKHSYQDKNLHKKFSFDDFEFFYKFDRELLKTVFSLLGDFEEQLKTSVAYNFSKNHCSTLQTTMEYTNKDNYRDPGGRPNYVFSSYQNSKIIRDFSHFELFKTNYLTNLVNKNDFIDLNIYYDVNYIPNQNVATYRRFDPNAPLEHDDHIAVPFWVAIQTLSLGTLNRLCHYLNDADLDNVMNDFGIKNINQLKREIFLNCLDLIVELRNNCAHGNLITRFRSPEKIKIMPKIITELDLFCYDSHPSRPQSKIALFDAFVILNLFVDGKSIPKLINKYSRKLYLHKPMPYNHKVFNTLLYRIGRCGQDKYHHLSDWNIIIKKNLKFNEVFG